MSKFSANQIVATMLEDYAGDAEDRAGGPKDMWRKGGFKSFSLKGKNFGGKRPGDTTKPVKDDDEEEASASAPATEKPKSRFKWSPTSESLLHELGGYWCTTCKAPATGVWDEAAGVLNCQACNNPLNYPKSNSLRSREAAQP